MQGYQLENSMLIPHCTIANMGDNISLTYGKCDHTALVIFT
jgi:hypothetical protein